MAVTHCHALFPPPLQRASNTTHLHPYRLSPSQRTAFVMLGTRRRLHRGPFKGRDQGIFHRRPIVEGDTFKDCEYYMPNKCDPESREAPCTACWSTCAKTADCKSHMVLSNPKEWKLVPDAKYSKTCGSPFQNKFRTLCVTEACDPEKDNCGGPVTREAREREESDEEETKAVKEKTAGGKKKEEGFNMTPIYIGVGVIVIVFLVGVIFLFRG
ncbi:unnamed protein product [Vitrella brassicaformis CCMP3155]|uniref:Uncharacterized protein n=1 Tax=Vitrella brassicaformis (strain CCMP3155) TaxID=1169540 RepID=A0A0G4EJ28_VITBC|nr:unnamed protein product [Vitrella brassicaformis CCMP3155]|eukprot:CEL95999.1 unnamed protein product [Vitrella brassicaformis CCMP3155]